MKKTTISLTNNNRARTALYIGATMALTFVASECFATEIFKPIEDGFNDMATVAKNKVIPALQFLAMGSGGYAFVTTRSATPIAIATIVSGVMQYMSSQIGG